MPALVGDAIIAGRQTIPDMTAVLVTPSIGTASAGAGTALLIAGNYFSVVTARTNWGESLPSSEVGPQAISGTQQLQISCTVPFGAAFIRVYYTAAGGASGSEQQFADFTVSAAQWGTLVTFNVVAQGNPGIPPTLNRAWIPDTDGNLVSAAAIYQWLNDGLKMISRETGGLLDYSGVQSQVGQPLYIVVGEWNEITSVWYDGYWMMGGDRGQFFRRNNITSQVLSQATISVINNQNIMEVYPQPARTAASTTLAAPMAATDTTAQLASAAGFVLPFGFYQVDSEIQAYGAIAGNNLTGLIRGLGGSVATAHAAGAPVLELNIFWSGKRQLSPVYAPGNSLSTLPIPTGWEVLLAQYIGGRAKMVEHDTATWDAFNKSMMASIKSWGNGAKPIARRRQIGGTGAPVSYYSDIAGGLILPSLLFPVVYQISLYSKEDLWHSIVHGGISWTFTFMCFVTLAAAMLNTWEKPKIQRTGRNIIRVLRNFVVAGLRKLNGHENFARWVSGHFLKLSKPAPKKHGLNMNGTGLLVTDSQISSMSGQMLFRETPMLLAKKHERKYAGQTGFNSLTQSLGNVIEKR